MNFIKPTLWLYFVTCRGLRSRRQNSRHALKRIRPIDMYLYLDSASVVMVEAGSTSHFRMAAMLNGPT